MQAPGLGDEENARTQVDGARGVSGERSSQEIAGNEALFLSLSTRMEEENAGLATPLPRMLSLGWGAGGSSHVHEQTALEIIKQRLLKRQREATGCSRAMFNNGPHAKPTPGERPEGLQGWEPAPVGPRAGSHPSEPQGPAPVGSGHRHHLPGAGGGAKDPGYTRLSLSPPLKQLQCPSPVPVPLGCAQHSWEL